MLAFTVRYRARLDFANNSSFIYQPKVMNSNLLLYSIYI